MLYEKISKSVCHVWIIFIGFSFFLCAADFIKNTKGLVLLKDEKKLLSLEEMKHSSSFHVVDLEIPGGKERLKEKLFPLYLNQPMNEERIEKIKLALYEYYRKQGYPLLIVFVPTQELEGETLQLVIKESKCTAVCIKGTSWSSSKALEKYLGSPVGKPISEKKLENAIQFMNRFPFRSVNAVYTPGNLPWTTQIDLIVDDVFPLQIYAGTDNTGVSLSDSQRLFLGLTGGGYLGYEHLFSYQCTASYDFTKFQAHTFQYTGFFPWLHFINLYGGMTFINSLESVSMRSHQGLSAQGSLRYGIPLLSSSSFSHELQGGFDYKHTNTNLDFSDAPPAYGKRINLTQLVASYSGGCQMKTVHLDFLASLFCSPGRWLLNQTNADYQTLRPGAENQWVYLRSYFRYVQDLPYRFSWVQFLQFQYTQQNLLPSEQIGIGGYDTVRGYVERELNFDRGLLFSSEFRSPFLPLRKWGEYQFIFFLDYGGGNNSHRFSFEPFHQYLLGTGPGLRARFGPYASLRLDWGMKLHQNQIFSGGWSRVHFSAVLSY